MHRKCKRVISANQYKQLRKNDQGDYRQNNTKGQMCLSNKVSQKHSPQISATEIATRRKQIKVSNQHNYYSYLLIYLIFNLLICHNQVTC